MLVRLTYASRAAQAIDEPLIKGICEIASSRNASQGITGVLVTQQGQDVFLQVLEGSRTEVNALYASIARDLRHRDVTLLAYEEIEQRHFVIRTVEVAPLDRHDQPLILAQPRQVCSFAIEGEVAAVDAQAFARGRQRLLRNAARCDLQPYRLLAFVFDLHAARQGGGIGVEHDRIPGRTLLVAVDRVIEFGTATERVVAVCAWS